MVEILILALLVLIAVAVWNIAKSGRASARALQQEAEAISTAATAATMKDQTSTSPATALPAVADPASRKAAREAVEAAEAALERIHASAQLMRELLSKGCPRGIAWTEWGDEDPSRDLAAEAESHVLKAADAALNARKAFSLGSAHPRVLGEIAIHVHRAANSSLEASSTADHAVESDNNDRDLLFLREEVYENAWNAGIRAKEAALQLGAYAHTTEPPGSVGAIIATIVETYGTETEAFAAHRAANTAENATYAAIRKLEKARTIEEVEECSRSVQTAIDEYKRLRAQETSASRAEEMANEAAESAAEAARLIMEANDRFETLKAGYPQVRPAPQLVKADWLVSAAEEAEEAVGQWSEQNLDAEHSLKTIAWSYSKVLRQVELAALSSAPAENEVHGERLKPHLHLLKLSDVMSDPEKQLERLAQLYERLTGKKPSLEEFENAREILSRPK
jgi:hypothetical protein